MITFCVVCIDDEMKPRGIHAAFFHALRSILILLILHHTDTASLNRNLFFLLRFFLSYLSRGNLNCLDMALNLTHTPTLTHTVTNTHTILHILCYRLTYSVVLSALFLYYNRYFGWWESILLPSSHVSDVDMVCCDCIIKFALLWTNWFRLRW